MSEEEDDDEGGGSTTIVPDGTNLVPQGGGARGKKKGKGGSLQPEIASMGKFRILVNSKGLEKSTKNLKLNELLGKFKKNREYQALLGQNNNCIKVINQLLQEKANKP